MSQIIIGSLLLSVLHALIPNHWLPILAIGKRESWSMKKLTSITLLSGLAQASSTVIIGIVLGLVGVKWHSSQQDIFHTAAPMLLIAIGIFFIYQHYRHKHFHLHAKVDKRQSDTKIILGLVVAMFLSPCFEIEPYFLLAGAYGWWLILLMAFVYTVITATGMVIWIRMLYKGLLKTNWHKLEHNTGIITGCVLIVTGLISYFIN